LADFPAVFFVDFFADFRAAFFADFFADFLAVFFVDFFADSRGAALPELPLAFFAVEREAAGAPGLEGAGVGGTGDGRGSDMGLSSIHPPLVQPVSISSDPDIGAPCSQRGVTRRRFRPPGPW
jgi:hypothetical protein